MVNEAYLNRVNETFRVRSRGDEARKLDRADPFGLRVDHESTNGERDAVGDSRLPVVQPEQPALRRECAGKGPLPELQQHQRQCAAEQRGIDEIVKQVAK